MNEERYILKRINLGQLRSELDTLWPELSDPDSAISQKAKDLEIDIEPLRGLRREQVIDIQRRESGLDTDAIVMAFVAHGIVEVAKAAWIHLILPRIKTDLGDDSIKADEPGKK
jgi:hypothetical protein